MRRKEAITKYFKAFNLTDIEINYESSNSISGTIYYNRNDPEEKQDFKWKINETDLPKNDIFELAELIGENHYLENDRLKTEVKDLFDLYKRKTGKEIQENQFKKILNSLLAIKIHMVDDGNETDFFFIHL